MATVCGCPVGVEVLVRAGGDVNYRRAGSGETPLLHAVESGYMGVLKRLVRVSDLNIDIQTIDRKVMLGQVRNNASTSQHLTYIVSELNWNDITLTFPPASHVS